VPAVHLHCAMHSFRTGEDRWFRHLGLQSNSHGPQEPIAITFVDKEHPIVSGRNRGIPAPSGTGDKNVPDTYRNRGIPAPPGTGDKNAPPEGGKNAPASAL
jgi:hypothetical protein